MAAGWSTVVIAAACAAGGYIAGDWVRQKEVAKEQTELRKNAEAAVARAVKAERRALTLEERLARGGNEVKDAVAQSDLAGCTVPEPASRVLDQMALEASQHPGFRSAEVQ